MYAPNLNTKDRSGAFAAAFAVQAALVLAFLNLSGRRAGIDAQSSLRLVDFRVVPPRPSVIRRKLLVVRRSGGTQSVNIKSVATALVAPVPVIVTRANDVATTIKPSNAAAVTNGAAKVRGDGDGFGGSGGGVGAGTGTGTQSTPDAVEPPRLLSPVLNGYDFPRDIVRQWPGSMTVYLRLKVDARGYVAECLIDRGTRVPIIDSEMCNTAHDRLRFRPALNRNGQPVAGWFGYAQPSPR